MGKGICFIPFLGVFVGMKWFLWVFYRFFVGICYSLCVGEGATGRLLEELNRQNVRHDYQKLPVEIARRSTLEGGAVTGLTSGQNCQITGEKIYYNC